MTENTILEIMLHIKHISLRPKLLKMERDTELLTEGKEIDGRGTKGKI